MNNELIMLMNDWSIIIIQYKFWVTLLYKNQCFFSVMFSFFLQKNWYGRLNKSNSGWYQIIHRKCLNAFNSTTKKLNHLQKYSVDYKSIIQCFLDFRLKNNNRTL